MSEFLSFLQANAGGEPAIVEITITLLILIIGHLLVKTVTLGIRKAWIGLNSDVTKKEIESRENKIKYVSYILDSIVIILALLYLNATITTELYEDITNLLPDLASILLIGLLGVLIINLISRFSEDFLKTIGIKNYFRELGLSPQAFNFTSFIVKGILYLALLQILLAQIGIGDIFIRDLINASSWAAAFLAAALLFYGFKDLFQNFAAGTYLKNARTVRPGEEVNIDGEIGEIKNISLFSTLVNTQEGYTVLTPNKEIMKSKLKFKRVKNDLDTLDEVKDYFVAQHPAYCGPAAAEMALEIYGYRHSQDEIGEVANTTEEDGTEVEDLVDAIPELTNNEVKAAFIEYDNITDLGDELKAWFNDGALAIPNFYKPHIFPDATTGHYVLAVGVEGNEILTIDPSSNTGGVYYVDKDKLQEAMGDYEHKRGYIILAPKGTTAHWRIKNDLIYADKNYYDELSRTLETRLRKIMRQGRILKDSTPKQVDKYLDKWTKKDKVTRVWTPKSDNEADNE